MKAKAISRSIRLSEEEAKALAELAVEYGTPESALLQRWVQLTLRDARIRRAVSAYERDEVDLRGGASMAGIPIGVFVDELAQRRVPLLDNPAHFEAELADLRAAFGPGREQFIVPEETNGPAPGSNPGEPSRRTRRRAG